MLENRTRTTENVGAFVSDCERCRQEAPMRCVGQVLSLTGLTVAKASYESSANIVSLKYGLRLGAHHNHKTV